MLVLGGLAHVGLIADLVSKPVLTGYISGAAGSIASQLGKLVGIALEQEDCLPKIRALLMNCLEDHYGSLEGCIVNPDRAVEALRNIQANLDHVKDLL